VFKLLAAVFLVQSGFDEPITGLNAFSAKEDRPGQVNAVFQFLSYHGFLSAMLLIWTTLYASFFMVGVRYLIKNGCSKFLHSLCFLLK